MIQQLPFLGLVVKDINAASAFYRDTLGLPINEKESMPDFYTQFDLNGGATFALLTGFEQEGIEQNFDAALVVDDIDASYKAWKEAGVEMLGEPRDMPFGRTFLFRTPEGHILRAMTQPGSNN